MYDSNSKGISYTAGFFILIVFVVAGLLLAGLISIPIWTAMTGQSLKAMQTELNNPVYANAAKIIQAISVVFGFFLPTLVTSFLLNRKPMQLLGFSGKIKLNQAGLVIAIMVAGLFVSSGLSFFNSHIPLPANWKTIFEKWENNYNQGVETLIGLKSLGEYLLALIIIAFLPALCEETLFRGGFQNLLTRSTNMPGLSIIIVSILFSAVHGSYYGFLSRFFLGVVLGLLYQYSGKIWLNILGHFVNNAIAVTAIYINAPNADAWWGILLFPLIIVLFILYKKISERDKEAIQIASTSQNNSENLF